MTTTENKPCWCNEDLPPPVASNYSPKGSCRQIEEFNTYVSGSEDSTKAVVMIYDIFGPTSQCLQGADRLAEHLKGLVIMPDLFRGDAPDHAVFEKDSAAAMAGLKEFMKSQGDFTANTKAILDLMKHAKSAFPSVRSWGIFGLCWGGKVAVLTSIAKDNPFRASGQTHPAGLSVDDAKAFTTPHICLPSKDEPTDVVDEYEKILTEKSMGKVERFSTMFHGWMGARANLTDQENLAEYQRGYAVTAQFFAQHL